jgi:uncharacterized protein involved in exopolysaccharide biosynthesis
MGISFGWAAASFVAGCGIGIVIAFLRHRHDLDAFRK